MKPILLPDLNPTEPEPVKPSSPPSTGYANHPTKPIKHTIKPAVHVGLMINHSPSTGISVERIEVHVILISD